MNMRILLVFSLMLPFAANAQSGHSSGYWEIFFTGMWGECDLSADVSIGKVAESSDPTDTSDTERYYQTIASHAQGLEGQVEPLVWEDYLLSNDYLDPSGPHYPDKLITSYSDFEIEERPNYSFETGLRTRFEGRIRLHYHDGDHGVFSWRCHLTYEDVFTVCEAGGAYDAGLEQCVTLCESGELPIRGVCPHPDIDTNPDTNPNIGPNKNNGPPPGCGGLGNPCNPSNGNKYQAEVDFVSADGTLSIERHYNSQAMLDVGFGVGWSSNLIRFLAISESGIVIVSATGKSEQFVEQNGQWVGDPDTDLQLFGDSVTGYDLIFADGSTESFNTRGGWVSSTAPNTRTTTVVYDGSGRPIAVIDPFGQEMSLHWGENSHIESISNAAGGVYQYAYDADDNLTQVTYPDGSSRTYHYEDTRHPNHLTGITDENGDRYATFVYDNAGRAISTEHADVGQGPQEKFQIIYPQ